MFFKQMTLQETGRAQDILFTKGKTSRVHFIHRLDDRTGCEALEQQFTVDL